MQKPNPNDYQVKHEFLTQNYPKNSNHVEDPRLADPKYICFRIGECESGLEFFCPTENFVQHSGYFSRLLQNREAQRVWKQEQTGTQ